jgi:hypothetical protein
MTETPTNTPTTTQTPTTTTTPTNTETPTNTPTTTTTPTNTQTPTPSTTTDCSLAGNAVWVPLPPTPTQTPTNTETPTITPTETPTNTPTNTPTTSVTPTQTNTPTITPTPTNLPLFFSQPIVADCNQEVIDYSAFTLTHNTITYNAIDSGFLDTGVFCGVGPDTMGTTGTTYRYDLTIINSDYELCDSGPGILYDRIDFTLTSFDGELSPNVFTWSVSENYYLNNIFVTSGNSAIDFYAYPISNYAVCSDTLFMFFYGNDRFYVKRKVTPTPTPTTTQTQTPTNTNTPSITPTTTSTQTPSITPTNTPSNAPLYSYRYSVHTSNTPSAGCTQIQSNRYLKSNTPLNVGRYYCTGSGSSAPRYFIDEYLGPGPSGFSTWNPPFPGDSNANCRVLSNC